MKQPEKEHFQVSLKEKVHTVNSNRTSVRNKLLFWYQTFFYNLLYYPETETDMPRISRLPVSHKYDIFGLACL